MSNQYPNAWPQEWVDALLRHYADGHSASYIARLIGHGKTRNAIIGKLHRLGLKRGASAANQPKSAPPRRQQHPIRPTNATLKARERAMTPASVPVSKPVLLTGREKVWTERLFGECAFPVAGEGADTLSCCAPARGSYCVAHRAIMFTSPDPEPRRKRTVRERTFYDVEAA